MEKKVVIKFGGSNLKSKDSFQNLVNVVKSYNQQAVIVISAFNGVTNKLVDLLNTIRTSPTKIEETKSYLLNLHNDIIEINISDSDIKSKTREVLQQRINEFEKYLLGISYLGDTPEFAEDAILSYGERFSSLVLSAILNNEGLPSEEILPEDLGLITDGEFGNATLNFSISKPQVDTLLSKDNIFVIPGFYGVSATGKVTLFGRGGSDYSASAIAKCINASSVDFWKDVNGFQTADPRLITNSEVIENLCYDEAAELAYFGAKILHPRAIEPLTDINIPIRIFNIFGNQNPDKPLTIINNSKIHIEDTIKSVTSSDDFNILKLLGPGLGIKPGILAKVTTLLDKIKINIKSVITSQTAINLLISSDDIEKAKSIIAEKNIAGISEILIEKDITTIAVIGHGMLDQYGIAARIFKQLANKKINIRIISLGASPVASYFIIDKADKLTAIDEIHSEFFSKKAVLTNQYI